MGYITAVLTPEERRKAGPKNGAQATATVAVDPSGAVSVHIASVPQGQGHRTVAAQIAADALGLAPQGHPRHRRARHRARRLVDRVGQLLQPVRRGGRRRGASRGDADAGQARARRGGATQRAGRTRSNSSSGKIGAKGNPDNAIALRAAGGRQPLGAWHRARGRAGAARDRVLVAAAARRAGRATTRPTRRSATASSSISAASRSTASPARCAIDKYVTMHDCGTMLHPGMVAGQITGGFAHALGAAVYEEFAYAPDGAFLSGTFADYLVPTTTEVPEPRDPAHRDALAVHAARRQGRRRRQLHVDAGLHRQRGRRRARRRATIDLPLTPKRSSRR